VQKLESSLLVDGLVFGEGPRWRGDRLWFVDIPGGRINTVDERGHLEVVHELPLPSGLGWGPDGALYVSTHGSPVIRRIVDGTITVAHDLSAFGWSLNDMVVGPDGRIYVDAYHGKPGGTPPGDIVLVTPDGDMRSVAKGLATPNGLGITPDGSTLIASETFSGKLLAFTIEPDGSLADQRVFADLGEERAPDGLCLDAEGAVWVGSFQTGEFLRVREGGEITHVIDTGPSWAVAPALGGADRCTLFLIIADTSLEGLSKGASVGRIEHVRVDVPGAGWP
jgi:sugar lactone lactonase YvrE